MRRRIITLGVTLGMLLTACDRAPTGPSRSWSANIVGVVLDSTGGRIPNANVNLRALWLLGGDDKLGHCSGSLLTSQTTQANSDGEYSFEVRGGPFPLDLCLVVDATAHDRGAQLTGSAQVDSVRLGPTGLWELQVLVKVRR